MKRSWFSRHPICFMALYLILYLSAFNFLNTQIHMPQPLHPEVLYHLLI